MADVFDAAEDASVGRHIERRMHDDAAERPATGSLASIESPPGSVKSRGDKLLTLFPLIFDKQKHADSSL